MKKFALYFSIALSLFLTAALSSAQTGPGGVGNSTNNILWLDASDINQPNNFPIGIWSDKSGNGNDASQGMLSKFPKIKKNQINNQQVLEFDGVDDFYELNNNITTKNITSFLIYKRQDPTNNINAVMNLSHHFYYAKKFRLSIHYKNYNPYQVNVKKTNNKFSILSQQLNNNSLQVDLRNEQHLKSYTISNYYQSNQSTIGARTYNNNTQFFFKGQIAEVIVFNEKLNDAKRKIIGEYLGGKYNLPTEAGLYAYQSTYGHDIIGVGQEANGSHTDAEGKDGLSISNPSSFNNGDYVIVGHDDAGYATSAAVGNGVVERWTQVWRTGKVGMGTVDLAFDLSYNALSSTNYVVLIDDDGDFTNGGSRMHQNGSLLPSPGSPASVLFNGVTLNEGEYFTLATKEAGIFSIASGNWNNPSTWSCNCVPNNLHDLTVSSGNTVSINSAAEANNLTIDGSLNFGGGDTLEIYGDLTINGTLGAGSGTIAAKRNGNAQIFYNNTISPQALHNLLVDGNGGLQLQSGGWSIENNLQVSQGGMDVSNADSITLISNATQTAQILPSMENAFSGEFIVQRYISNRNPNYANLSSPISNATVADLDDEAPDVVLSGVNGNYGNILYPDSSIFYSMFFYDAPNSTHQAITSTTTALPPAKGFEVYLLNSSETNFTGATVDFRGTPNSGEFEQRIYWKWNLVGNPYQSHIDFDKLQRHRSIDNKYQIFNSSTGSYDLYTGSGKPYIAPGQGFWVSSPANYSNGRPLTFNEDDKVNSHSSAFKRKKRYVAPNFNIKLESKVNQYSHKLHIAFDPLASKGLDDGDLPLLPSPIEEAPAITAVAESEQLILNNLNPNSSSQLIPLNIHAGMSGAYEIQANNLSVLYENYSCAFLKDNALNKNIDLMVEPGYAFEAEKGDHQRFELVLSNTYEDCHQLLKEGAVRQKLNEELSLRNAYNQWYVDYDLGETSTRLQIKIYNMQGQLVKAIESFEAKGAGSHALQNTDNLRGIYVVQVQGEDESINQKIKF